MCWKLAVVQVAKSRAFEQICTASLALDIAKQWRWDGDRAVKLVENLKQYYQCKDPFAGGQANEKDWWENLPISAKTYPLKSSYSQLSLMQQMSNDYFRVNYSYHVHQRALAAGQPVRRKHAHMHTRNNGGIDMDLAMELDTNFAWTPPLVSQSI
ncbi:hypothetical protein BDR04DRAFT_1202366 [Suillus decipiens]|nr:hypothetical protein BDR04DRAFT_1202366 [Suillus decipiens]